MGTSARFAMAACLVALAATAVSPRLARADRPTLAAWDVQSGTLRLSPDGETLLAATDPDNRAYSQGVFLTRDVVKVPYELSLMVRRLAPDPGRSFQVRVLGAIVLVGNDGYGLWIAAGDAAFARDGLRPLPGYRTQDEHRIAVRQDAHTVTLSIDGRAIDSWRFDAPGREGQVGFGLTGARGYRAWMLARDARIASQ
jgi:hypothetical protein